MEPLKDKVADNKEDIENNEKIKEELNKALKEYRKSLVYMGANVPIECLCLPDEIQSILIREGILRVYDIINRDLGKIKGIGSKRRAVLAAHLDEFFAVGL